MKISKADLEILKKQREKERLELQAQREHLKKEKELEKEANTHHSFIANLNKRIKGIEPWARLLKMKDETITLLCYFKMKQLGISDVKLLSNNSNTWLDFDYVGTPYIFDLNNIKNDVFDSVVKKSKFTKSEKYTALRRTFSGPKEFFEYYAENITYTFDELKIEAMKEPTLNLIFRPKNK